MDGEVLGPGTGSYEVLQLRVLLLQQGLLTKRRTPKPFSDLRIARLVEQLTSLTRVNPNKLHGISYHASMVQYLSRSKYTLTSSTHRMTSNLTHITDPHTLENLLRTRMSRPGYQDLSAVISCDQGIGTRSHMSGVHFSTIQ